MDSSKHCSHLRLHIDEDLAIEQAFSDTPLDRLCLGISALSGWQVERSPSIPAGAIWNRKLSTADRAGEWLSIRAGDQGGIPTIVPEGLICELAGYLHDIVEESRSCQESLSAREAELATAIPVVVDVNADSRNLARRLEAILKNGASAVQCDAAALYMLDDTTEHLKLRCHWNLGPLAYNVPPRPLHAAAADVEALAGHAIAVEDTRTQVHWQPPHPSGSAICVPVASSTTLLGTLWAFGRQAQEFTDRDTGLWEIVAGSLAAELEREAIVRDKVNASVANAAYPRTARAYFPSNTRTDLHNEAWSATTRVNAMDMDRTVIVDMCESEHPSVRAVAVVAHQDGIIGASQASRTFARWHEHGGQDDFLTVAHDELFRESTGDGFVSAASVELDNLSGKITLRSAGHVESYLVRPYAWEPWTQPSSPLGDATAKHIGQQTSTTLHAADWALIVVGALPRTLKVHNARLIDGQCLAETLLRLHEIDVDHAADALWRLLQEHHAAWQQAPSLILIRRVADIQTSIVHPSRCSLGEQD